MSDINIPGDDAAAQGWITPMTIVLFVLWLAQVVFIETHIRTIAQIKPKNAEDVKRDEKYACFRQVDVNTDAIMSRLIIYFTCAPLVIFRLLCALIILTFMATWVFLTNLLIPKSSPLHRPVSFFGTMLSGYGLIACCSVLWVTKKRPKVCYKKYLGPDWEPTYEGQSTNIFNHSAWIDTLTMMTQFNPSFVAKASVR